MLGVLLLVPGVLFLGPRSVPGIAGSWALRVHGRCWLLDIAGSWALRGLGIAGSWVLGVAGPGSLGSLR